MPTININRNVFEKLVGKKLPTEKLKDRISMLGTDLEDVTEKEIIVEIFPNRPDMLSVQGFARAFSAFINVKTGLRQYKVEPSHEKMLVDDIQRRLKDGQKPIFFKEYSPKMSTVPDWTNDPNLDFGFY